MKFAQKTILPIPAPHTQKAGPPMARRIATNVGNGLAIRDDGVLVPMTPRILEQTNVRPFTGDPRWSLEARLRWLAGLGNNRRAVIGLDQEPFNVRTANKEQLLELMATDYGINLDARKDADTLRKEVIEILTRELGNAAQAQHQREAVAAERAGLTMPIPVTPAVARNDVDRARAAASHDAALTDGDAIEAQFRAERAERAADAKRKGGIAAG